MEFKFKIGDKVKCILTGFTGIVVVQCVYLTGCNRYGLQIQKMKEDGKPYDWEYFDEDFLVKVPGGLEIKMKQRAGRTIQKGGVSKKEPPKV